MSCPPSTQRYFPHLLGRAQCWEVTLKLDGGRALHPSKLTTLPLDMCITDSKKGCSHSAARAGPAAPARQRLRIWEADL